MRALKKLSSVSLDIVHENPEGEHGLGNPGEYPPGTLELSEQRRCKNGKGVPDDSTKDAGTRVMGSTMSVYQSTDPIFGSKLNNTKPEKDPSFDTRTVHHPTTYMETVLHLFKANIGSGVYAMGDGFKNGGLAVAPILTVFIAIISVHSQHLLLMSSEEMQRRTKSEKPPDYAETAQLCFQTGPPRLRRFAGFVKFVVDLLLCVTQLGFCCVYFVLISTNTQKVGEKFGLDLGISSYIVISLIPVLLTCLVRNLKYLTPFSTLANALMILGLSVVLYYSCQDTPALSSRPLAASWSQLPLFFGTTIYAFEGIGLVLPLKSEMQKPEHFRKRFGVLNVGMVIVTIIFLVIGFMGYLKWGEEVEGSLTLNLPSDEMLGTVVQGLTAGAILFTFPLQFYVAVDIIWYGLAKKYGPFKFPVVLELCLRSFLVLITFILAISIPHVGLFISLVGAIGSTALALLFPPIIELVQKAQTPAEYTYWIIIKNTFIISLGLLGFATGTYESVAAVVRAFQK